jgi:heme-degrading monooxygenase HmoA
MTIIRDTDPDLLGRAETGPVVTMLRMRVRPGCEEEFVRAWEKAAGAIAGIAGQISQELLRDEADPRVFVVLATWSDRAGLDHFGRGIHRDQLTEALRELRESAERNNYHSLLRVKGSDG